VRVCVGYRSSWRGKLRARITSAARNSASPRFGRGVRGRKSTFANQVVGNRLTTGARPDATTGFSTDSETHPRDSISRTSHRTRRRAASAVRRRVAHGRVPRFLDADDKWLSPKARGDLPMLDEIRPSCWSSRTIRSTPTASQCVSPTSRRTARMRRRCRMLDRWWRYPQHRGCAPRPSRGSAVSSRNSGLGIR